MEGLRAKRTAATMYHTANNIIPIELNIQHTSSLEILGIREDTPVQELPPTVT